MARAAIGTPGLGLAELERFGPVLRSHLVLKLRQGCPILDRLWLLDTPGMIDSADESIDRGYDFFGVLRWLAERADLILLLFDPQKPGTTGETLKALTTSLAGLDHKLLIVLNKADELRSIHDFARAYGALCWNLAKVITRKDLPRIYNCYIPGPGRPAGNGSVPVSDLDAAREEILAEVRKVPDRRVDNIISRLHDDARQLLLHARMCTAIRGEYWRERWRWRLRALFAGGLGALLCTATQLADTYLGWRSGYAIPAGLAGAAVAATLGLLLWGRAAARQRAEVEASSLDALFERICQTQLTLADAGDLRSLWERVRPHTRSAINLLGVEHIPRVSGRELRRLAELLEQRLPALRGRVHSQAGERALPSAPQDRI